MQYVEGRIMKATGGFYYVKSAGSVYECRARGLFRKQGVSPLVGDLVKTEQTGVNTGYITEILPRKNALVRPPVANLDKFVIVTSVCDPAPNLLVIDKMMAIACHKDITPVLVITKADLEDPEAIMKIYGTVGIEMFVVSSQNSQGIAQVRQALSNGVSAFSGNSGVGKSTLLNRIDSRFEIETGETSQKLGRGRHTTRHVELYQIAENGYIADTPGFSAVETERYELIFKDELAECFPEFAPFQHNCKFTGCSHTSEKGCAVLRAMQDGLVNPSRHENYCVMYEEAKKIKEWEHK